MSHLVDEILADGDVQDAFCNLRGAIDNRWQIEAKHEAAEDDPRTPCLRDFPGYFEAGQRERTAEEAIVGLVLERGRGKSS